MKKPTFKNIPQFTKAAIYKCDVSWTYAQKQLKEFIEELGLNLDPNFQRAHVQTEEQQIAYVEYVLKGGKIGRDILFNCESWISFSGEGEFVVVDGKQRLQAVRKFMNNELKAFGFYLKDYQDPIRMASPMFVFYVNDLETREQVLQWYLEINTTGTPHTKEEIKKVEKMLKNLK